MQWALQPPTRQMAKTGLKSSLGSPGLGGIELSQALLPVAEAADPAAWGLRL